MTPEERRARSDAKVAQDVQRYGCHVISVFDPDQKEPFFSYSIGIQQSSGAPEAIVIGLRPELGGFVVNEYNRRIRKGQAFYRGVPYKGFLRGFPVYIEPVLKNRNADYTYGKRRLREIDRRVRFLIKRLESAEVVRSSGRDTDQVFFGAQVRVRGREGERTVRIVGVDEVDPARGLISWISPVAKALLKCREGDTVTVRTPAGDEKLEIMEVSYP